MKSIFSVLGKVGRGFATVTGVSFAAGGVAADPQSIQEAFQALAQHGPAVVAAVGFLVSLFGIGRKAGVHK